MKKLLFPLFAVLLVCAPSGLRAQATPTPIPTWAQSYGFGSYDQNGQPCNDNSYCSGADLPTAIAPMPDGGVVVAGRLAPNELEPGSGANAPGLVRYDRAGAIVWQQLLRQADDRATNVGRDRNGHVNMMKADAAGNVFVCGVTGYSPTYGDSPFVAKFSPAGALLWQNGLKEIIERDVIRDVPTDSPYSVTDYSTMDLTSDGGVVVGSSVYSAGNGHTDPIIVKFKADGSVAMHRIYAGANQYSGVISVCGRQDASGFAVLLTEDNRGFGSVMMLTNASGDPVSQRTYNADRTGGNATFMTRSADGGYFLLGDVTAGKEVRKLGSNLTPLWQKTITRYVGGNGLTLAPTLSATADGGCILGSYSGAYLLILDRTGVLRAAHAFDGGGGEGVPGALSVAGTPLSSCVTTDGGLAFTITTFSYATGSSYKADWWVVKADADGKVPGFLGKTYDISLDYFSQGNSTETASFASSSYGPGLSNEIGSTTASQPRFVPEDLGMNIGINKPTVKTQTTTPIPPPLHGGLSGITFAVNESTDPLPGLADTVLRFRAVQSSRAAGLSTRVQSSTDNGTTWKDLADGADGRMTYVARLGAYVLNSKNYPTAASVYFRSVVGAGGFGQKASNPVGPFNLTSSVPRLSGPLLLIETNGPVAPIRFGVKEEALPSGIDVRIQASQTPADEASWADAPIGSSGHMTKDTGEADRAPDPRQFYLTSKSYPGTDGVYFRAIATAPGYADAISFPYGPLTFIEDPAAKIQITLNGVVTSRNDIESGYVLPGSSFSYNAKITSNGRPTKNMTLLYDGITLVSQDNTTNIAVNDYRTNIPGDHIIEAYATDDLGVTGAAPPIHVRVLPAAPGRVFAMIRSGDWNDPSNWSAPGNGGVPGPNDFAILSSFSPTINSDLTVNAISLNGGTIGGSGMLTVSAFGTIAAGKITGNLTIPSGSTLELLNDSDIGLTGRLRYSGTIRMHGKGGIARVKSGAAAASNGSEANSSNPASFGDFFGGIIEGIKSFFSGGNRAKPAFIVDHPAGGRGGSTKQNTARPANAAPRRVDVALLKTQLPIIVTPLPAAKVISNDGGSLIADHGDGLISQDGGSLVASGGGNALAKNPFALISQDGGSLIADHGDGLISQDGGGLRPALPGSPIVASDSTLLSQDGGGLISQDGGGLISQDGGGIKVSSNGAAASSSSVHAASEPAALVISGGETDLSGLTIEAPVILDGGILSGTGFIFGDLTNNGGFIAPGHSPGAIAVLGNFSQGANGTMILENGGSSPTQFDQLNVSGTANLSGKLIVNTINGYTPDAADTFNPLAYSAVSGGFSSISGNAQLTFKASGAIATVNPAVANAPAAKLLNIATRMRVDTGDNALIGGFFITGAGSKKVLIRALAPSLAPGVAGTLDDPTLELDRNDAANRKFNDDWQQGDTSQIPSGFAPKDAREALIVATVPAGPHTAIVSGKGGATGVAIVEVYDLEGSAPEALANISTRGLVQTGDNVMIGGLIIGGTTPTKVLLRAIGPSLTSRGIVGALQDTELDLVDGNGNSVNSNQDWRNEQESAIAATGVPPSDDREAAILATLVPGNYTAIVRGKDGTTGVAVVEAYNLQ